MQTEADTQFPPTLGHDLGGGPNMLFVSVGLSVVLHQIIFDQIISPRILGNQVGLHPILSIIALLSGNLLLGIIGMILAVPVAACIQIAVLAMIPKLSKEIEIAPRSNLQDDTVRSLELETKEEHQKVDATGEMHSAVAAAVESISTASVNQDSQDDARESLKRSIKRKEPI